MDVRLPDGTIIRGIPEGTTRAQLAEKLARNGYDVSGLQAPQEPTPAGEIPTGQPPAPPVGEPRPQREYSFADKVSGGMFGAFNRAAEGLRTLIPGQELDAGDRARLEGFERFRQEQGGPATLGAIMGDVGIAAAPLGAANRAIQAAGLVGKTAFGANMASNAAYSAAVEPENRAAAGTWGAVGAGLGEGLSRGLARAVKPMTPGTEAQRLLDAGVPLTAGQVAVEKGPLGRALGRLEEAMAGVPLAGAPLRARRQEAMEGWQQATRNDALPPGRRRAGDAESVGSLIDAWDRSYRSTLSRSPFPRGALAWDPVQAVPAAAQRAPVTREQAQAAEDFVQAVMLKHIKAAGAYPRASAAHAIESELKQKAGSYLKSMDPSQRELGQLYRELADDWAQSWRSALPDARTRNAIARLDERYANFIPVREAAAKVGATVSDADPSAYTPAVLLRAIRQKENTSTKRGYIQGGRPQQRLATAGQRIIGNKVADSGTTERLMSTGGLLSGGALATGGAPFSPAAVTGALAAGGALATYGTRPVQRYLTGQLGPLQTQIADYLRATSRASGQLGRAVATPED